MPGNTLAEETTNSTVSTNHKVSAIIASIFKCFGLLNSALIAYKTFLHKLWQDTTMGRTFTTRIESAATDFQNHYNSRLTGRLFAPMQLTSKSMDSVTTVKESVDPAYTFAQQATTTQLPVNFVLYIKGCTSEATNNTKMRALCSYIVDHAVQDGHSCP